MKIAIVGGGATGLFLGKLLAIRGEHRVVIFEKSAKAGRKIKASGGGRANIFHMPVEAGQYNRPDFVAQLLQQIDAEKMRKLWLSFGMPTCCDEEGRAYPMTYFSQTVLDVLLQDLQPTVEIRYECEVKNIRSEKGKWCINNGEERFDKVVLCSGSPAGLRLERAETYNTYLQYFNFVTQPLSPSLVGFRLHNPPSRLEGCRTKAEVSLYQGQRLLFKEAGEVIFKADGISGIVILNASAYYAKLSDHRGCSISLDFLYSHKEIDPQQHMQQFHSFNGLLHPKLNNMFQKQPFDPKRFHLSIAGTYDWDEAQVCHGGVSCQEVDSHLEARRHPGLYIGGEMLDIDGVCGGYNLFFACACGYVIFKHLISTQNQTKHIL